MSSNIEQKRHSLAHLLAAAVMRMWPETKVTIGPAVENGFYYDFDFGTEVISEKELSKIEKKMRETLKDWIEFSKIEVSKEEAEKVFVGNPYKLELIASIAEKGEPITLYKSGYFQDLCRGGHVESAKDIDPESFKLVRVAGAYWKGDEKNKMLTRIYGVAFDTKAELDAYLTMQEEAKKRDHKKLGKELDLFVFSDLVGPGLPLYTFKGTTVRREIIKFSNELQSQIGYQEVHTPNINKGELFKISGHYEKYKEDMLKVVSNYTKEEYFLKPMNCPQHTQIYASKTRSYRELPIRIADFANLHRDEQPGQLSGLTRLRCFCQDDGHAFCREDQIAEEFSSVLSVINKALEVYKMNYKVRLSLWDPEKKEKYLGDPATWEKAQKLLEEILVENKVEYFIGVGEAAFYGPKMDIMTTDSLGRSWQISTIQLDFQMPARFGLAYTDKDGKEKTPVMIHRALIGSPERFMGVLIEHYAGNFPTWLTPVQVKVIPVRENHNEFARTVYENLKTAGIRAELNDADENLGKKVREAKNEKVSYMLIVGDKEVAANAVTVENRDKGNLGQKTVEEFVSEIAKEIKERK
ncbi:MAG: threonine--tRNA ligase [Candidatus Paceibacterota bacterium]|jgi:threonyl-tRNA synthetase